MGPEKSRKLGSWILHQMIGSILNDNSGKTGQNTKQKVLGRQPVLVTIA
jgi:hypothetical protein